MLLLRAVPRRRVRLPPPPLSQHRGSSRTDIAPGGPGPGGGGGRVVPVLAALLGLGAALSPGTRGKRWGGTGAPKNASG